jgi:hypothetical protein
VDMDCLSNSVRRGSSSSTRKDRDAERPCQAKDEGRDEDDI